MDATDEFVMAETLYTREGPGSGGSGEGAETMSDHFENVVRVGVLRCLSMLRFRDYSKDDWYAHYLNVTEMNARNVAEMVRTTVRGEDSPLETSLHEPLAQTMRQVRNSLLHHPPRTRVERVARLSVEREVSSLHPTQKQVELLTEAMGARFDKLFSGQVYRIHEGHP